MHPRTLNFNARWLLLILFAWPLCATAQEVNISGSVINPSQHPVSNVKVYLKSHPAIYCYSDSNGMFHLSAAVTSVGELANQDRIIINPDGSVQIRAMQNSLCIDFYDLLGRKVREAIIMDNLTGTYRINPGAYFKDLPEAIYIAQIRMDEHVRGIKISNLHHVEYTEGLIHTGDYEPHPPPALKSLAVEDDTLVFHHDYYRAALLAISSYSENVGVIQLENFGDYTVAEGMEPDKTTIHEKYGGFIQLTSAEGIKFAIGFDSLCCYGEELEVRAIPISGLDFMPDFIKFRSGIHLEPSGTKFLDPVHVIIEIKGPLPDSLVVFGYNNDAENIYILPFDSFAEDIFSESGTYYLETYFSHFSGIGVGEGWIEKRIEELTQEELESAEGRGAYIAYHDQLGLPIRDDYFPRWLDDVLTKINAVKSFEELVDVITELTQLMTAYQISTSDVLENSEIWSSVADELSEKITALFNEGSDFCANEVSNDCLKYKLAKAASKLMSISQFFNGLQVPEIHEFCNHGITDLVNAIHFDNSIIYLKVGEESKIPYKLTNIDNDTITDESIIWISNDPSIVTVNQSGKIMGLKEGSSRIVGSWCELEKSIIVKVTEVDCGNELCKYLDDCIDKGAFSGRGRLSYDCVGGSYDHMDIHLDLFIDFVFTYGSYSFLEFDYHWHMATKYTLWDFSRTQIDDISLNVDDDFASGTLGCRPDGWIGTEWIGILDELKVIYHGDYLEVKFSHRNKLEIFTGTAICPRISKKLSY